MVSYSLYFYVSGFFHLACCFWIQPLYCLNLSFIPWSSMMQTHFHLPLDRHSYCSQFLTNEKVAMKCMNMPICFPFSWVNIFFEQLDHIVTICFTFKNLPSGFLTQMYYFYVCKFQWPHILTSTWYCEVFVWGFLSYSSNRYIIVSCGISLWF